MSYELSILTKTQRFIPAIQDGITLKSDAYGSPESLEFTVIKDKYLSFEEGAQVIFSVDGKKRFNGFVFSKDFDKKKFIQVTAYDQLRYMKNKDSFLIENEKASDFLIRLCAEFDLIPGDIEDTGYVIEKMALDNMTLIDMVNQALEATLMNTGRKYCYYDNDGRIDLKDIEKNSAEYLITNETASNFKYSSSIEDTYNRVKLIKKNDVSVQGASGKKKKIEVASEPIYAKDAASMAKFGTLQFFSDEFSEVDNIENIAQLILEVNSDKKRSLSISRCFGDPSLRGGKSIIVDIDIDDDLKVAKRFFVNSCTHYFLNDDHNMDVDLIVKGIKK